MTPPQRMALFGGSFDPVHLGHLEMARRAHDACGLDQVRFLPCQLSPHKLDQPPSDAGHRLAMLRLATAPLPWACVDDFELRDPGPSYSLRTVEHFRREYPSAELFWILGGDQWETLPTWKSPEKIAQQVQFIVIARGKTPQPRPGYRMQVVPGEHPASSTAIRRAIRDGGDVSEFLPAEVLDYLRTHPLYR